MSDKQQTQTAGATGTQDESLLLPEWAFVVQFRVETELEQGHCVGRVEHVVSGQATQFHTLDELLAFLARVLARQRNTANIHDVYGQTGLRLSTRLRRHLWNCQHDRLPISAGAVSRLRMRT